MKKWRFKWSELTVDEAVEALDLVASAEDPFVSSNPIFREDCSSPQDLQTNGYGQTLASNVQGSYCCGMLDKWVQRGTLSGMVRSRLYDEKIDKKDRDEAKILLGIMEHPEDSDYTCPRCGGNGNCCGRKVGA